MADTALQWLLCLEYFLKGIAVISRVEGVNQIFLRIEVNTTKLIIAEFIDYFLISAKTA